MHALACEGVEVSRQGGHKGLALPCRHLCHLAVMQRHAAHLEQQLKREVIGSMSEHLCYYKPFLPPARHTMSNRTPEAAGNSSFCVRHLILKLHALGPIKKVERHDFQAVTSRF